MMSSLLYRLSHGAFDHAYKKRSKNQYSGGPLIRPDFAST